MARENHYFIVYSMHCSLLHYSITLEESWELKCSTIYHLINHTLMNPSQRLFLPQKHIKLSRTQKYKEVFGLSIRNVYFFYWALEPVHLLHESVCWTDIILIRTEFLTENLTDFQTDFQTNFEPKSVPITKKIQLKMGQNLQILPNNNQLHMD